MLPKPGTFDTVNEIAKRARMASREWSAPPSYADQLAADLRELAKRADAIARPSTSTKPVRCAECGEWSLGACRYCRTG